MLYDSGVQSYDYFYDKLIGTEYKFAWLPEKCYLTGERICLKRVYRWTRMIT